MRITTMMMFVLCGLVIYGQEKGNIDERLLHDFELNEIEKIYLQRPDYYNYLVYQLDNSFEFVTKKEANKMSKVAIIELKSLIGEVISERQINSTEFNWLLLPVKQNKDISVYYKTKEGTYVKLISLMALKEKFMNSGLNSK